MKIPTIATKSIQEIEAFQFQKLKETLEYVSENSPFYKKLFASHNVSISQVTSLEALHKLPFTTKDDLQQYNDAFFCVPKSQIIDYVTTSGTMGDPVTVGLTEKDLERLEYNEAISLACSGVTSEDTVQLMTTLDRRFMAGLAYFLGLRKLGASVIRVGSGVPELQWDSILKFKPDYIICVPSFLLKLIAYAKANNIAIAETSVKNVICIGEPIREANFQLNTLGQKIKAAWDINLFSTYASTEMQTAFNECTENEGGHAHPDLIITEVLDENDEAVSSGEIGELVITTLGVEAMPLIRFKTGDMVQAHTQACPCGRNTKRLGPVVGRKQQMIKYKGTTLYPPAMYNVLQDFEQIQSFIIEIFQNEIGTDEILLKVVSDDLSEAFKDTLKDHFRAKLRVRPTIEFTTQDKIEMLQSPSTSRKPIFLVDRRV
jgi:phenylacetate-CoA ligase